MDVDQSAGSSISERHQPRLSLTVVSTVNTLEVSFNAELLIGSKAHEEQSAEVSLEMKGGATLETFVFKSRNSQSSLSHLQPKKTLGLNQRLLLVFV